VLVALQGPEYLAWLREQPEADYMILMGATTYRVMSRFAAGGEPGTDALVGMGCLTPTCAALPCADPGRALAQLSETLTPSRAER
jgi:hypothetical protein